jgi:hypothetical protein
VSYALPDFLVETLTAADVLRVPEIDIEVPMTEFYAGVEFAEDRGVDVVWLPHLLLRGATRRRSPRREIASSLCSSQ